MEEIKRFGLAFGKACALSLAVYLAFFSTVAAYRTGWKLIDQAEAAPAAQPAKLEYTQSVNGVPDAEGLGAQGWEMCAASWHGYGGETCYFKRRTR
jgi:hypothetical protein